MASHTSAAQTSGANAPAGSNLQHYVIQVDSVEHWNQHFVNELLDSINPKNEELSKLLGNYFDNTHETINFYTAVVQEYLDSANNYQSLVQDGEEASFNPINFSHHHFFHNLASIYRQQLLMRDSLQSFRNDLSQKLRRVKSWTNLSAVAFTASVVITSAAAAATAKKPAIAAATAAAPILLGTIGTWMLSLLRKYKDAVKKHDEIARVMGFGAKMIMSDLSGLYLSARQFEFLTMSAADAGEVRMALMESFQELQGKASDFSRDIHLARELTLQSVIKHLDCVTSYLI